jgi:hypothetical protein
MCNFKASLVGGRFSGLFDFPNKEYTNTLCFRDEFAYKTYGPKKVKYSITGCDTTSFFYGISKKRGGRFSGLFDFPNIWTGLHKPQLNLSLN